MLRLQMPTSVLEGLAFKCALVVGELEDRDVQIWLVLVPAQEIRSIRRGCGRADEVEVSFPRKASIGSRGVRFVARHRNEYSGIVCRWDASGSTR